VTSQALLSYVFAAYKKPTDLIGENELLKQLTKAAVEAALSAKMTAHLGHDSHCVTQHKRHVRNGHSTKTVTCELGEVRIDILRDRGARFRPQLIGKHQGRFPGMDERTFSQFARRMTTREIAAHVEEMFGAEVSQMLISAILSRPVKSVNLPTG
jgi:putative transposase